MGASVGSNDLKCECPGQEAEGPTSRLVFWFNGSVAGLALSRPHPPVGNLTCLAPMTASGGSELVGGGRGCP